MKPSKLYSYLVAEEAFVLHRFMNDAFQSVELVEHPIYGDDAGLIVCFPKYAVAFETDFFDINDLTSVRDYQPLYIDEDLKFAYEVNSNSDVYESSAIDRMYMSDEWVQAQRDERG